MPAIQLTAEEIELLVRGRVLRRRVDGTPNDPPDAAFLDNAPIQIQMRQEEAAKVAAWFGTQQTHEPPIAEYLDDNDRGGDMAGYFVTP